MVTRTRRGAGRVGCLLMLLVVAVVGYFGLGAGSVYWNYYQFRDRLEQEARFADSRSDAVIKRRIAQFADSLGLPAEAKRVQVRRQPHRVSIEAAYEERIELPFMSRQVLLSPRAEWTF